MRSISGFQAPPPHLVTPAKAGAQTLPFASGDECNGEGWAPAFAGVTGIIDSREERTKTFAGCIE
jgi:hypothetical protein